MARKKQRIKKKIIPVGSSLDGEVSQLDLLPDDNRAAANAYRELAASKRYDRYIQPESLDDAAALAYQIITGQQQPFPYANLSEDVAWWLRPKNDKDYSRIALLLPNLRDEDYAALEAFTKPRYDPELLRPYLDLDNRPIFHTNQHGLISRMKWFQYGTFPNWPGWYRAFHVMLSPQDFGLWDMVCSRKGLATHDHQLFIAQYVRERMQENRGSNRH